MDHWEERAKQPGVAGVAKYMAAFIRFLKSSSGIFGNKSCINICRKKLGLHWVKDSEVQRAVGRLSKKSIIFIPRAYRVSQKKLLTKF